MALRDWLLVAWAPLGTLSLAVYACARSVPPPPPRPISHNRPLLGVAAEELARCEVAGRSDREAQETIGPGSAEANIRRVFALIGDRDDKRRQLLCREVDTNFDGIKDVVRTYNEKGEPLTEFADTDFDGRVDTWITFAKGRVLKVQVDNNRRGEPDETRFYLAGKLNRIQRDTNFDGKPDVWETYNGGRLERIGEDLDHDGHVDRWNRDEVAQRLAAQREQAEEEQSKQRALETSGAPLDASTTDAQVSARKR